MKLFSKLVAAALLLMMFGVPAMACVFPDAQLSKAERACCRAMAHQCGDMDVPNGHSCCQTTVKRQPAILKPVATITLDRIALVYVPTSIVLNSKPVAETSSRIRAWRHPPPLADVPSIEILRI